MANITKRNLNLYLEPIAFTLSNVLSQEECEKIIKETEEKGYTPNLLNVGKGNEILSPNYLDSNRCILIDQERAKLIFDRIKEFIPQEIEKKKLVGLHEKLRVLRYQNTQRFEPHLDASEENEKREKSLLTVLIYLNENCEGGSTSFEEPNGIQINVFPKTGQILVFEHNLVHSGTAVQNGVKYVIRSELMYK